MQSSSRNPAASGLLSVQAELRQRQKAATSSSSASASASTLSQADDYNLKAYKGKKLSSDFVVPKEGTNHYDTSEPSHKRRKIKPDPILDKYRIKGRDPNAAIYSATAKTPSAKLEAERLKVLRAKAKAYESLSSRPHFDDEDDGDEDDPEGGLIDFKRKAAEHQYEDDDEDRRSGSHSDDDYHQREEDEEMVTYIDELGRTRTAPRSEVPRELLPENNPESSSSFTASSSALPLAYGRQTAFPIYRPPSPKLRAARALRREVESGEPPRPTHFDPKAEVRNRGAGLFQFAKDEKERQTQMDALQRERARTERERLGRLGGGVDGSGSTPSSSSSSAQQQQGFASAEDRPWGGEGHDHEEGGLGPDAYEDDHRIRQQQMYAAERRHGDRSAPASPPPSSSAPVLDPFAAVELAAAQQKKRKKDQR
ncbi:hypothetical protein OC846_003275 [Tilletia horrida]|uniref:Uncharacterized protein n=1 Tax=Tilletia horrida TaxID=155126 RepID=A0AAN6GQC2_9BASI|nr:hypothetical protein OC845_006003 [Tilletia horrida]KAK0551497.1 hypothetical protein OC846_003275 [Tilletia horrida]KAK0566504.1 hypothetical protein OC861_003194 [Tilletia horrida]